jgi:hypothetical protein
MYGGEEKCNRVLVGKHEGKRPPGRPRHSWDNIKMDLQEIGQGDMSWIYMAQDEEKWLGDVNICKKDQRDAHFFLIIYFKLLRKSVNLIGPSYICVS